MFRFNHLSIKNWKNFNSAEMPIGDRMFIVGANASGKSNLMDVFRFLRDVADSGLVKAVESRGGIKKLRYLNARNPNYIEISTDIEETSPNEMGLKKNSWLYTLQFNSTGGGNNTVNISAEFIKRNDEIILDRKYNDEREDYLSRQFTYLEQPAMNVGYRGIYDFFKAISYVNIIPQLIRESHIFVPAVSYEDFYGRNLIDIMADAPERTRKGRLKIIENILRMAVPNFSDLEFVQDERGRPHLQIRYEHFRPHGAFQKEDQFSDGTLRLIGLIWAILSGDGLLLLEEPELYLHTEIIRQLPLFIEKAQRQKNGFTRQTIISSHSFDILNTENVRADEIAVLKPEREATGITMADSIDEVNQMIDAGFTPADAITPVVTPKGIADGQLARFEIAR